MDSTDFAGLPKARRAAERGVITMDGPVLIFGGCYSNLEATHALLEAADAFGVPRRRVICTGDVVAYGADARETVRLIRSSGIHVVMGNCEESLGTDASDCGCGFADGSACDRLSTEWYRHARAELDEGDRAWMRSLPRRFDVALGGRRLAVVHGGTDVINTYVFSATAESWIRHEIDRAGCDGVIGGHCGLPFTRIVDGRLWHNSGAIGMPANDGTSRTWYSLLVPTPTGIVIQHHALVYDYASAAAKMRDVGLPEGYAAALESGLWPSCDVLPDAELALRGRALETGRIEWAHEGSDSVAWPTRAGEPARAKFSDPEVTATGERRAAVALTGLKTLWINTGTLCNLACTGCYIESSPRNDRLAYIRRDEVRRLLDEARADHRELEEIAFTGGEPFMNPELIGMVDDALSGGWRTLVLTNATKPMHRQKAALLELQKRFADRLAIRVSLDHFTQAGHEEIRGRGSWSSAIEGLVWLARNGFNVAVASRTIWDKNAAELRAGYRALFARLAISIDCDDPARLVLFPEMDDATNVPEITERCWTTLGVDPNTVMCATSRMVIKRKGADSPTVVSCTLLPYDGEFEMGTTLAEARRPVKLNHRYCAQFCVLGGASCSRGTAGGGHR